MHILGMDNIELRKKLLVIYYDVLSEEEQLSVLRDLGLTTISKVNYAAFTSETKMLHSPIAKLIKVMKAYL